MTPGVEAFGEGCAALGMLFGILSVRFFDWLADDPLRPLRWLRRGWRRLRLAWRRFHFDDGAGLEGHFRELLAARQREVWWWTLANERARAEALRLHRLRGGL